MMVAIECRTVGGHISHKKTGDVVECNLSSGLRCTPGGIKGRNVCHDYEIRVLCNCGELRAGGVWRDRSSSPSLALIQQVKRQLFRL